MIIFTKYKKLNNSNDNIYKIQKIHNSNDNIYKIQKN